MRTLSIAMGIAIGVWALGPGAHAAETTSKGVGPIKQVQLEPVNAALADKGKAVFEQKCTACHKFEERYVGPALGGVTTRRPPEWIMNMILNPSGMLEKDPVAKELLGTYMVPMTFQNVTQADARAILEYARSVDAKTAAKDTKAPGKKESPKPEPKAKR